MREYGKIVELVSAFLNKNKIPYVIVGSVSVAAWGSPRTSYDVDIMIMLEGNIKKFVNFLKKSNFSTTVEDVKAALKERSHFTVFDNLSVFRLDVKGIYTDFDRKTLERRRKVKLFNRYVWVCSPEDLILVKLDFGSEKDLNDAEGVLVRQKKLDMNYLQKGAKDLGVYGRLKKLMKETKERVKKY